MADDIIVVESGDCSCDMLMKELAKLRKEIAKGIAAAPKGKDGKKPRQRSGWQNHLSVCLKTSEVKALAFNKRVKKCAELWKAKKAGG